MTSDEAPNNKALVPAAGGARAERSHASIAARHARLTLSALAVLLAFPTLLLGYANFRLHVALRGAARDAGVGLTYGSAYTLSPGVIQLQSVQVSGGSEVLWAFSLPRAEVRLGLLDLLLGRLHVKSIRGVGLEFNVFGVAEDSLPPRTPERDLVALGVIPSIPQAASASVRIDHIESSVHGVQVGDYRLAGALRFEAHSLKLSEGDPVLGRLELQIGSAALSAHDEPLLRSLNGRVTLYRSERPEPTALDAAATLKPTPELRGALRLSGADAGELLDFLGVPEPVHWIFSSVHGQPFTVVTRISQRPGAIALRDVRAQSGQFSGIGALRDTELERAGAFLLMLGEQSAGILVGARSAEFVLGADRAWLTSHQRVLGLDESGRSP